jgi:S-methylmethionine-dependent homocysteine/selenocysteine methylase
VVTSSAPPAGLIGGIINRQQLAALDVLYANYLAAGAACLTARGYQVQMNVPGQ